MEESVRGRCRLPGLREVEGVVYAERWREV